MSDFAIAVIVIGIVGCVGLWAMSRQENKMSDKVKAIKKAIQEGTYKLDIETTAEKIILLAELGMFQYGRR